MRQEIWLFKLKCILSFWIYVSFIHYPPPVSFTEDICHQLTHWEKIVVVPTCSFVTYISILKTLRNSYVKAPTLYPFPRRLRVLSKYMPFLHSGWSNLSLKNVLNRQLVVQAWFISDRDQLLKCERNSLKILLWSHIVKK